MKELRTGKMKMSTLAGK